MTAPPGGPPDKCEAPAPDRKPAPTTTHQLSQDTATSDTVVQHRRRRGASRRLEQLHCGCCTDPHTTRHRPGPAPRGYQLAAEHLDAAGLLAAPPDDLELLRELWRDDRTRELAGGIASAWAVTHV